MIEQKRTEATVLGGNYRKGAPSTNWEVTAGRSEKDFANHRCIEACDSIKIAVKISVMHSSCLNRINYTSALLHAIATC